MAATGPKLPDFGTVFFPLNLRVDGEVEGHKFNYAFECAAVIYHRDDVSAQIVKCVQAVLEGWGKDPDRNKLNWAIFEIVANALVDDLQKNGKRYAEKPEDRQNPVPGLTPGKTAENQAIIDKLIAGAKAELRDNLVVKENDKDQ
jgi:hypothetical protein